MKLSKEKLKPCPFCGKRAVMWQSAEYATGSLAEVWRICCNNEKCLHRVVTQPYVDKPDAIKAWNGRQK